MTPVDYSKLLATLLKERTLEIHDSVATSDGANLLTSGKLSREEYTRYLMMLWHVYELVLLFVFYSFFTDLPFSLKCS
jgi:heme oxygenase